MKPYYQDDAVTIFLGDAVEIVPTLGRFDCCLVDPPYGKVKGHFDEIWTNRTAMLTDCIAWRDILVGAMKPNATLWWFAWPSLAGRIEALVAEKLKPLAHVVWIKPTSLAQKHCPEALRAPGPETERIIMAEHYGADNMALGESGYVRKCDALRASVFEPLRAYLLREKAKSKLTNQTLLSLSSTFHSHYWAQSQWALPTEKDYTAFFEACNKVAFTRPYKDLLKEHKKLRKDYEDLRKDYEDLRRYFELSKGDPKTDVWRFNPSRNKSGHPTEKPLDLISFMVRISCRPGGTILDCFGGSGTTGRAAKDLGRKAVLIEREERYCEIAAKRMGQEVLAL